MNDNINSLISLLNKKIEQLEYGQHPPELYDPIEYIMKFGGKRIRPLLALLAYQLYESDLEHILEPVIALELFHNFTLMHDDIMDKAPLRRGRPTIHEKWNENIAILSGDVMMIKVYDLLLKLPTPLLAKGVQKFNACAAKVCEGQQMDMNFESTASIDEAQYMEMISKKTAELLGFSLEFGAFLAGAPEVDCSALKDFGMHVGIGFQLTDDLLDAYSDTDQFGKQIGGDIIANKKTYLLIKALELAGEKTAAELQYWLTATDYDPSKKVEQVLDIYEQLDIKSVAEKKIGENFDKGFESLVRVKVSEEKKADIVGLTKSLIYRKK
jgi:geranylgeranyl diphosphate synthase, type II